MNRSRAALAFSFGTLINASAGCTGAGSDLGGPVTVAAEAPADFNADSHPDLLWHNGTTGATQSWSMSGTSRVATVSFDSSLNVADSSGWVPVGILLPDHTSTTRRDLLWHNGSTGALQLWRMNSDGTRASIETPSPAINVADSSGWRIVATGTFGITIDPPVQTDLVWHNGTTGATQIWFMVGVDRSTYVDLDSSLNLPDSTGWRIVGADDFDVDGRTDLVWHNGTTGETQIWYMDTNQRLSFASLDSSLNVTDASGWRIAVVADFDSDGHPDFVWHNGSTGETQIWYMNGTAGTNRASIGNLSSSLNLADSTGWHIVRP